MADDADGVLRDTPRRPILILLQGGLDRTRPRVETGQGDELDAEGDTRPGERRDRRASSLRVVATKRTEPTLGKEQA
jgi:hypothetical protein